MAIINLLDLQPTTVSRDLKDYSMMITGESGIGKTDLAVNIYGKERSLVLAFENSIKGISGIYGVDVDSYATLSSYITQLENPKMREKFDTIIIDTLFLLDHCIEKSITDAYGVDLLKDALKWNAGYKIVDKRFLSILKRLQKAGYTLCYIAHPATKKVKINGVEIDSLEPKVSNRIKDLLMPEIDIRLFCYTDENNQRWIATQKTAYYDARCRVAEMSPIVEFHPEILKAEFARGIDIKQAMGGEIVDKATKVEKVERTFEEIMMYINNDLATKIQENGLMAEASKIIVSNLGRDEEGKPRTLAHATPAMIGALETIVVELEMLLGV